MAARNEFYDQFYDHSFCVFEEKDVLQTDIKGSGLGTRLRRWWFDQFLLSKQNMRCRKYYVSSFSVTRDRLKHYRNYRRVIHPFSKFRTKWEWFMLDVLFFTVMLLHFNVSVVTPDLPYFTYIIAVIAELITIVDLLLNTIIGYVDRDTRTVVLNPRDIMIHYFSTNVCFDAFSAIPMHIILFVRYGSNIACEKSLCKSNSFVGTTRIFFIFKALKLVVASRVMSRKRMSYNESAFLRICRIFILFVASMLTFINLSDDISLMYFINTGEIEVKSFFLNLISEKFTNEAEELSKVYHNIAWELSRVTKSLLLFGYVAEDSRNVRDKAKVLISFIIANLFSVWGIIECYGILNRNYFSQDKREILKDRTINLLRSRQLPDALGRKIRNFYKYSDSKAYVVQRDNTLYAALLDTLKKEIRVDAYGRYVKRIPLFANWPSHVLNEIVVLLEEDIYLKEDVVSSPRSQGDGLVIVEAGELSVFNINGEETSHLIDGDYFGELSLVTDKEMRMSTVVAVYSTKVLFLDKAHFRKLMKNHPHLFFSLKRQLKEKFAGGDAYEKNFDGFGRSEERKNL